MGLSQRIHGSVAPRICVIHDSEQIRETICVLLADIGEVTGIPGSARPEQFPPVDKTDLLIVDARIRPEIQQILAVRARILWLLEPGDSAPASPGGELRVSSTTPANPGFSPSAFRRQVDEILASPLPSSSLQTASAIDFPWISRTASALLRSAERSTLPVLIGGEVGSGKSRVVLAIHQASESSNWLRIGAGKSLSERLQAPLPGSSTRVTLSIPELLDLDRADQDLLTEILDQGGISMAGNFHRMRLVCATTAALEELAESPKIDRGLFYRLAVLPIVLEPLRDRRDDIPALVESVNRRISTALGRPPVEFSAAAIRRLQNYLWFGNLAELETVLARSIALAPGAFLDLPQLLFGYGSGALPIQTAPIPKNPVVKETTDEANSGVATMVGESSATRAADLIINELAHEFKNPLVAIKTVTQQLDQFTRDDAGRKQVAKLAGDAVERMDRAIDNLVQYSQFGEPSPTPVPLASILSAALEDVRSLAGERQISLDDDSVGNGDGETAVYVDAAQIVYALENLLRAVMRDVDNGRTVHLRRAAGRGGLEIEFPKGGLQISKRLAEMLGQTTNGHAAAEPLGYVFAKSLIERNAGKFTTSTDGKTSLVRIELPLERTTGTE